MAFGNLMPSNAAEVTMVAINPFLYLIVKALKRDGPKGDSAREARMVEREVVMEPEGPSYASYSLKSLPGHAREAMPLVEMLSQHGLLVELTKSARTRGLLRDLRGANFEDQIRLMAEGDPALQKRVEEAIGRWYGSMSHQVARQMVE